MSNIVTNTDIIDKIKNIMKSDVALWKEITTEITLMYDPECMGDSGIMYLDKILDIYASFYNLKYMAMGEIEIPTEDQIALMGKYLAISNAACGVNDYLLELQGITTGRIQLANPFAKPDCDIIAKLPIWFAGIDDQSA